MIRRIPVVLSSFVLAASLAACGGGDACDQLAKELCKDSGVACDKAKTWLDGQLVGPKGDKMSSTERATACKMVADDKEAVAAFKTLAASELGGKQ